MSGVLGIHHVSAIAGDPQRNVDFYAGVLGLRMVKRTVNFDDPNGYHLYYADGAGTPGCVMTFFPWPGARAGRQGTGQVAVTAFAVRPESIGFWVQRLVQRGVAYEGPRAGVGPGERAIAFRDPDGTMLEIVGHPAAEGRPHWGAAPGVPAEHALRGFHGVTLWVERGEETERVLTDTLGFRAVREHETTRRFAAGDGGPGTLVDVRTVGGFLRGTGGAGTVHHVAFRVADDPAEGAMRERVIAAGLEPTPVIDRMYFHSVYFREPGHVLYELATDGPGFAVDEPVERLGEQLKLPPQYEPRRAQIEAALPPIHLPAPASPATLLAAAPDAPEDASGAALGLVHRYVPPVPDEGSAGETTLLLLHGTGGDEDDLLPLGRALLPGAGMLSPRGAVSENGAARFFRRLAEGVFDQEDLARRTDDLAAFVERAAAAYRLTPERVVAVGFSNGANIAASLLLRRPGVVRTAVLLSPMVPFEPETLPDLAGTRVFIGAGRHDPLIPAAQSERLATLLREAGAEVTLHWVAGGHAITAGEVEGAREWLAR